MNIPPAVVAAPPPLPPPPISTLTPTTQSIPPTPNPAEYIRVPDPWAGYGNFRNAYASRNAYTRPAFQNACPRPGCTHVFLYSGTNSFGALADEIKAHRGMCLGVGGGGGGRGDAGDGGKQSGQHQPKPKRIRKSKPTPKPQAVWHSEAQDIAQNGTLQNNDQNNNDVANNMQLDVDSNVQPGDDTVNHNTHVMQHDTTNDDEVHERNRNGTSSWKFSISNLVHPEPAERRVADDASVLEDFVMQDEPDDATMRPPEDLKDAPNRPPEHRKDELVDESDDATMRPPKDRGVVLVMREQDESGDTVMRVERERTGSSGLELLWLAASGMDGFTDSSSNSRGGRDVHDENKENNAVENKENSIDGEQGEVRSVVEEVKTQSCTGTAESSMSAAGGQSSKAASRRASKFVATKKTPADANEPSTTVATRSTRSGKRKAVDSNSKAERDSASAPGPAPAPKPKRKKPTVRDGTKAPKPAMPYTYKERPPNATERRAAEEMEEDPWVASFTRKTAVCVGCGRTVAITGYLWDGHLKPAILDAEGRQKEGQEGRELFLPSAWRIHREACEGVAAGRAEEVKAGKVQEEPKHNMGRCRCNCAEKGVPRSKRNHM